MKKTYTLIGFILASGFVFGQNPVMQTAKISQPVKNIMATDPHNFHPSGGYQNSGNRDIIWSNDFSVAADWNLTNTAGNNDNWVIGTDVPDGAFPIDPIASSTAANGYALFDSDLLCSGDQQAYVTTAVPIDCSANTSVQVRFSQYYRSYFDTTFVVASTDGINWTKYQVNPGLSPNDFNDFDNSSNPNEQIVNISDVAAGENEVYIGFYFYSTTEINANGGCGYAWMVDDVFLETLPGYELALGTIFNGDFDISVSDLSLTTGPYYAIPVSQATPISIWTVVKNVGASATENVTVELGLDFEGTSVGTYTYNVANLDPGEIDSILIVSEYIPTAIGTVTADLDIIYTDNIEGTTENNTGSTTIEITNDVYALDEGGTMSFNGFANDQLDEWQILNLYEIQNDIYVTGVSFALTANPGDEDQIIEQSIFVDIIDLVDGSDFVPITNFGDNVYDIGTNDLSAGTTVLLTYNFEVPILLDAGKTYAAQLTFNTVAAPIFFANSGSSNFDFNLQFQDGLGPFTANNWLIRLNTDEDGIIGLNENSQSGNLTLTQNQPNPVRDNTIISYELKNSEKVSLEIYDITGKLISTMNEGNKAAGNYNINYNASKLNAGIYTYTLVAGDARLTKKMTVVR